MLFPRPALGEILCQLNLLEWGDSPTPAFCIPFDGLLSLHVFEMIENGGGSDTDILRYHCGSAPFFLDKSVQYLGPHEQAARYITKTQ